jgi:Domain of unknown function (DUF397)
VDEPQPLRWRRSPRCESGACVEVAQLGDQTLVRDSKDPEGPILRFGNVEWVAFVEGIQAGEFEVN